MKLFFEIDNDNKFECKNVFFFPSRIESNRKSTNATNDMPDSGSARIHHSNKEGSKHRLMLIMFDDVIQINNPAIKITKLSIHF